jgi:Family of unknown function (DUF6283)
MSRYRHEPCAECPWRRDVPTGHFPPERFKALANTAYDMSCVQFACHLSAENRPRTCTGFLLRGAEHNLAVRIHKSYGRIDPARLRASVPLYNSYRQMAVANGVDPDDPALEQCR